MPYRLHNSFSVLCNGRGLLTHVRTCKGRAELRSKPRRKRSLRSCLLPCTDVRMEEVSVQSQLTCIQSHTYHCLGLGRQPGAGSRSTWQLNFLQDPEMHGPWTKIADHADPALVRWQKCSGKSGRRLKPVLCRRYS